MSTIFPIQPPTGLINQLAYSAVIIFTHKINTLDSSPLNFNKGWGLPDGQNSNPNDPSGRVIVSFPDDPLLVEKVKSIDGCGWHSIEKHWSFLTYPLLTPCGRGQG